MPSSDNFLIVLLEKLCTNLLGLLQLAAKDNAAVLLDAEQDGDAVVAGAEEGAGADPHQGQHGEQVGLQLAHSVAAAVGKFSDLFSDFFFNLHYTG